MRAIEQRTRQSHITQTLSKLFTDTVVCTVSYHTSLDECCLGGDLTQSIIDRKSLLFCLGVIVLMKPFITRTPHWLHSNQLIVPHVSLYYSVQIVLYHSKSVQSDSYADHFLFFSVGLDSSSIISQA